ADVPAIRVADEQDHARLRRDLLDGEPVDATRAIAAALGSRRRALVLDEGGLDLAVAHQQTRGEEPREVLAGPAQIRPDDEPVLLLAQELLGLAVLHALVLERGVPGRQDESMEGCDHGEGVPRLVRHAPLGVEGVLGDRLRAHAQRVAPLLGLQAERRGAGHRRSSQEQHEHRDRGRVHLVSPTMTRLKAAGVRYFAATRWTSAAVTRPIRSLYLSAVSMPRPRSSTATWTTA